MIDCKITENYLKEKNRMTDGCMAENCELCPLSCTYNNCNVGCLSVEYKYADKAIAIVQKMERRASNKDKVT